MPPGHYSDVIMSAPASQMTRVSIVCSAVCSGAEPRKHQSPWSLAIVRTPPPPPPPPGPLRDNCFHLMTSSCIISTLTHVWFLFRINSRVTDWTVGVLRRFLCRCGRNGLCGSALFLAYISILLIAVLIVEATGPCISVQLRYVPASAYRYNCDLGPFYYHGLI